MSYENAYSFNDPERSISIERPDLPAPWINYLSNGRLHAFVSQAGGGFLWWKSPLTCRLTRYRFYNLPLDSPGFYVYIREKDGVAWSPTFRPCETPLDSWSAKHMPGKSVFTAQKNGLQVRLTLFIVPDYDTLVWDLVFTNLSKEGKNIDVFPYVELAQFDLMNELLWGCYARWQVQEWYDKDLNALIYLCNYGDERTPLVYLASSQKPAGYVTDRDAFIGPYRSERNPVAVENNTCDNKRMEGGDACGVLQNTLKIPAGGTQSLRYFLGAQTGGIKKHSQALAEVARTLENLRDVENLGKQESKIDAWWNEHFSAYQCSIPDKEAERVINTWNPVQSVHNGRLSRSTSFYAVGQRGIGFRDTCQDMLAIAYRRPEWAKNMFFYQLGKQFEDGHAVHTSWAENERPPQMEHMHSDDHLWLPLLAYAIVAETGNVSMLSEKASYIDERGNISSASASAWEHLLAAVRFTEDHMGAHGIPLTLRSDWNDIIGYFARKGRGESIFASQQYVYALRLMVEMAEAIGDTGNQCHLQSLMEKQISALENNAWDGRWFRRGFDDDGNPVGSSASPWGRIFINPQSWAVMSGSDEPSRLKAAMDSVSQYLDTGIGLKKLDPGFPSYPQVTEPFNGYNPGTGENGAIFCHAHTWAIIAEALLGNATRAWKYYLDILPHNIIRKIGVQRYGAEPYAYASNIIGPENVKFGFANVTQLTGTAAWMDIAATQYLLGVRPTLRGLLIDPCIPKTWRSLSVKRRYRDVSLDINIENHGVEKGVKSITIDGVAVSSSTLPYIDPLALKNKREASIKVVMG
ncbi:MAG: glycosyl hydrolase family 65 protein [Victivallales bacterium]